ncbi:MAG TPA: helix-hairpin-helix domain-containing protein, partial [Steroidobacteraceae bacterium]|nr:helix-hairpin-helix domain-containing protein [Steroidobacteraceae bacterium]
MAARMHNEDIASLLEEMGDLLDLRGEDPFRVRAYRRAALELRGLQQQAGAMIAASRAAGEDPVRALDALPAIGKDLGAKIVEMVDTGSCRALDKLRHRVPPGLLELLRVPGLGPRRVQALHSKLHLGSRQELAEALRDGRILGVPGFGAKLAQRLLNELERGPPQERRWLRPVAAQQVAPLVEFLLGATGVRRADLAGSYRRGRDTVGDIDLLVCTDDAAGTMQALRRHVGAAALRAAGAAGASIRLASGLQVDVRLSAPASYGAALHYFTGSKAHNIHVRGMAQERGLKINEYGVFRGRRRIAGQTEESVFEAVGLPWIEPELREDRGEIEAALHNHLPVLVTREALRGDLHVHTDASDGGDDLAAMARAAQAAGLEYIAITDHSKHLGALHGLDARRLREQMAAIDALNRRLRGLTLLKGVEVDVLEDGSLALPDEVLAEADVVIAAVHGHFDLGEERQTERVLRAVRHPLVNILGHPSGRLLGERHPMAIDMARVCRAAHRKSCCLELDGQPQRLDIDDVQGRLAHEQGVLVSIASDAHRAGQFV